MSTPIQDRDGTPLAIGDRVTIGIVGTICDVSLPDVGIDIRTDFGVLQAVPPRTVNRVPDLD